MHYCYLNGVILPESEAAISVRDIGLLRGYAIYDGLRTYSGKPFMLYEHYLRLRNSASELGLVLPLSQEELEQKITDLVAKNGSLDQVVRIFLTGGPSTHGMKFNPQTPTLLILTEPLPTYDAGIYTNGVKLITYEHKRDLAHAKTTNYITAVKIQPLRRQEQAFEVLYTWQNKILEATTSNFFLFLGDTLVTPKQDVLGGITRQAVLRLASQSFAIEERDIDVSEIDQATEAFITSSFKEIVPVIQIDAKIIGDGKVGHDTRKLMDLFRDYTSRY